MIEVFYISNTKQLNNLRRVFRDLAKYDGRSFKLTKYETIKDKRSSKMSKKSPFIPKQQFLQGLAGVMGQQFGSVPPAFIQKLFGGGFAPQRGEAAYNVYLAAQKQRLAHFMRNMDMFADPRQSLMTSRGQMIANYDNQVGLFKDDKQVGSSLNRFLTEA